MTKTKENPKKDRDTKLPEKAEIKAITKVITKENNPNFEDGLDANGLSPDHVQVKPAHQDMIQFINKAHIELYKYTNKTKKEPSPTELNNFLENPPIDNPLFQEGLKQDFMNLFVHLATKYAHEIDESAEKSGFLEKDTEYNLEINLSNLYFDNTYDLRCIDLTNVIFNNSHISAQCRIRDATFDTYIENVEFDDSSDLKATNVRLKIGETLEDYETEAVEKDINNVNDTKIEQEEQTHIAQQVVGLDSIMPALQEQGVETKEVEITPFHAAESTPQDSKQQTTYIGGQTKLEHAEPREHTIDSKGSNKLYTTYYKLAFQDSETDKQKTTAVVKVRKEDLLEYAEQQQKGNTASITLNQFMRERYNFPDDAIVIADLSGQELSELNLKQCNFTGAKLQGVQFKNCELSDSIFKNTDLSNASFYGIKDLDQAKDLDKSVKDNTKLGADCTLSLEKKRGFKCVASLPENQGYVRSGFNYLASASKLALTDYVAKPLSDEFKQQNIKDDIEYADLQAEGLNLLALSTGGTVGSMALGQVFGTILKATLPAYASWPANQILSSTLGVLAGKKASQKLSTENARDFIRYLSDNGMYIDNQLGHNLAQLGKIYKNLKDQGANVDNNLAGGILHNVMGYLPQASPFVNIIKAPNKSHTPSDVKKTQGIVGKVYENDTTSSPSQDTKKSQNKSPTTTTPFAEASSTAIGPETSTCIPTKNGVTIVQHPQFQEHMAASKVVQDQDTTTYYKIPVSKGVSKQDIAVVKVSPDDLKQYAQEQQQPKDKSKTLNDFMKEKYNFPDKSIVIADLSGQELSKLDLSQCNFSGARLQAVQFKNCKLAGSNFENADLRQASFYGIKDLNEAQGLDKSVRENTKLSSDCNLDLEKKRGFSFIPPLSGDQSYFNLRSWGNWMLGGANKAIKTATAGYVSMDYLAQPLDQKKVGIENERHYGQLQANGLTLLATVAGGAVGGYTIDQLLSTALPGIVSKPLSMLVSTAGGAVIGNAVGQWKSADCIRYLSENGMYINNQMGHDLAKLGVLYDAIKKSGAVTKMTAATALYTASQVLPLPNIASSALAASGIATGVLSAAKTTSMVTEAYKDISKGKPLEEIVRSNTQRAGHVTKLQAAITMAGVVAAGVATVAVVANPYTLAAGIGAGLLVTTGAALYYRGSFFEKAAGFFNKVKDKWNQAKSAIGLGKEKELEEDKPLGPKIKKVVLSEDKYTTSQKDQKEQETDKDKKKGKTQETSKKQEKERETGKDTETTPSQTEKGKDQQEVTAQPSLPKQGLWGRITGLFSRKNKVEPAAEKPTEDRSHPVIKESGEEKKARKEAWVEKEEDKGKEPSTAGVEPELHDALEPTVMEDKLIKAEELVQELRTKVKEEKEEKEGEEEKFYDAVGDSKEEFYDPEELTEAEEQLLKAEKTVKELRQSTVEEEELYDAEEPEEGKQGMVSRNRSDTIDSFQDASSRSGSFSQQPDNSKHSRIEDRIHQKEAEKSTTRAKAARTDIDNSTLPQPKIDRSQSTTIKSN